MKHMRLFKVRSAGATGLLSCSLLSLTLSSLPVLAQDQSPAQAQGTDQALAPLFEQARFWRDRQRADLAEQSLERVLDADPGNRRALYLLAEYALTDGDMEKASRWQARLAEVAPEDDRVEALAQEQKLRRADGQRLAEARSQAAAGDYAEAMASYRAVLEGDAVPPRLAPEVYLTLAGTDNGWSEARERLAAMAREHPDEPALATALGQVLSYREATRRQGIERLAERAATGDAAADRAWRQALEWLEATPADEHLYAAYQQAHPEDSQIAELFADKMTLPPEREAAQARAQGYDSLEQQRLDQAEAQFQQVLEQTPDDADAQGGLGLTLLRQQRFAEARDALEQAIRLAPERRDEWQAAYESAAFYARLGEARAQARAGRLDRALELVTPLTRGGGDGARAATLLQADLFKRQGRLDQAEQRYLSLGNDTSARLGLVDVYRRQQRWSEAEALAASLPASARAQLGDLGAARAQALRQQAAGQSASEAEATLREALALAPADPWVRLDLARLLDRQGRVEEAGHLVRPLNLSEASAPQLQAAALYASEQGDWDQTRRYLAVIPLALRDEDIQRLADQAEAQSALAAAEAAWDRGDRASALERLDEVLTSTSDPGVRAQVAQRYQQMGLTSRALELVEADTAGELDAPVEAYTGYVAVLASAGRDQQAKALVQRLEARDDFGLAARAALDEAMIGARVAQADRLRQQGQLASAYDVLASALRERPEDQALLLAMARLYQDGGRQRQAGQLYDYTLSRFPESDDARLGAADAALAQGDSVRASRLLVAPPANAQDRPRWLLSRAGLARAQGQDRQALALLREARSELRADPQQSLALASATGDNPFENASGGAGGGRPAWLPGGSLSAGAGSGTGSGAGSGAGASADEAAPQASPLIDEVERMMAEVRRAVSPKAQGGLALVVRSGEEGLSQFDRVETPTTFTSGDFSSVFGRSRAELTVTPAYGSAGTPSGDAERRFGRMAIVEAIGELASDDDVSAAVTSDYLSRLGQVGGDGLDVSADSQSDAGVGLSLGFRSDLLDVDVGTTPLGFDQSQLVGGLRLHPKVGDYGEFTLTAERRAVKDSLLSYAGTRDPVSGEHWGGVVKTGGALGYSFDNGDSGAYASLGGYRYTGDNVADNDSLEAGMGAYLRPINERDRELKAGVHVNYLDFDRNLSRYSFGHGGYFSPQDHISVAFPVSFSEQRGRWSYSARVSPGFQSYSEAAEDFFPTDGESQALLDDLADADAAVESRYSASSESGFGLTLGGDASYQLTNDMRVGGRLGYDTFGDYDETSAWLYLDYTLGGADE
ncbi:cellulose synthase subunit BcsC-related outer membrane protein [Halomonas sp. EF61]|uniref:cellulose biosynthesis protein BcsC n=1 Tax=Halomonas sp. EF61 TaxID=2950869 RepID=UPI0032DF5B64